MGQLKISHLCHPLKNNEMLEIPAFRPNIFGCRKVMGWGISPLRTPRHYCGEFSFLYCGWSASEVEKYICPSCNLSKWGLLPCTKVQELRGPPQEWILRTRGPSPGGGGRSGPNWPEPPTHPQRASRPLTSALEPCRLSRGYGTTCLSVLLRTFYFRITLVKKKTKKNHSRWDYSFTKGWIPQWNHLGSSYVGPRLKSNRRHLCEGILKH